MRHLLAVAAVLLALTACEPPPAPTTPPSPEAKPTTAVPTKPVPTPAPATKAKDHQGPVSKPDRDRETHKPDQPDKDKPANPVSKPKPDKADQEEQAREERRKHEEDAKSGGCYGSCPEAVPGDEDGDGKVSYHEPEYTEHCDPPYWDEEYHQWRKECERVMIGAGGYY